MINATVGSRLSGLVEMRPIHDTERGVDIYVFVRSGPNGETVFLGATAADSSMP